jgi:zinc transporter ZupT
MLCVSLLETMALGISQDTASAALTAASIALHQPAESLSLLVSLAKTALPPARILQYLLVYSLVGPVGMGAGYILGKAAPPLFQGVLMAITAGTLLYAATTEVSLLTSTLSLVFSVVLMCVDYF